MLFACGLQVPFDGDGQGVSAPGRSPGLPTYHDQQKKRSQKARKRVEHALGPCRASLLVVEGAWPLDYCCLCLWAWKAPGWRPCPPQTPVGAQSLQGLRGTGHALSCLLGVTRAGRKSPLSGSLSRGPWGMARFTRAADQSGQKPPECLVLSCTDSAVRMEKVRFRREAGSLPVPLSAPLGPLPPGILALCALGMAVAELDAGTGEPVSAGHGSSGIRRHRAACHRGTAPPRSAACVGSCILWPRSAAGSPGARRGHIWFPLLPRAHNKTHGPPQNHMPFVSSAFSVFLAPGLPHD